MLARATAVLLELPERTRVIFVLRRLEGMRYLDIAARLGISVSAVAAARARRTGDRDDHTRSARLYYWDEAAKGWRVRPGQYRLMLGASATDIRAVRDIEVQAPGRFPQNKVVSP